MEGTTLHPTMGSDGAHLFDAREVAALASSRRVRANTDGEIAARACELFREGKGVVDVVIELHQPFDVVQPLARAYLEDDGGLFVPGVITRQIESEFGDAVGRLSADDLLRVVRNLAQRTAVLAGRAEAAEWTLRDQERDGAMVVPGRIVREIERACASLIAGAKLSPSDLARLLLQRKAENANCSSTDDPSPNPGDESG
jgi:hypothetical protein